VDGKYDADVQATTEEEHGALVVVDDLSALLWTSDTGDAGKRLLEFFRGLRALLAKVR
jgi:hypothetical protein